MGISGRMRIKNLTPFPKKELDLLLRKITNPVDIEIGKKYQEIGIRSHGKGIFYKDEVVGNAIGNKRVFWIEPNCFIVNIVFAWEQAVAKTTEAERGLIASHRFPMYKVDEKQLDLDYLLYFFKTPRGKYLLELASPGGAGRNKTLGQKNFLELPIPLPPIEEQHKIVQILSTWDEAIEDVEELIEKKKRLRRTFLQTIVVGKKKIAEFKNSKWIAKSLSELGAIVSGGTPDTTQNEFWDGQIAWCTPTDITALKGKREISKTNRTITENGLKKSSANILPKNSIIVCTRATIGDAAMNTVPMATNQGFKSLVPNKANDSNYLYYLILTLKKTFIRFSSGSTFLELSKKDFAKTTVTIPESIEEQRKIAEIMIDIDEEIELLKTKRTMLMDQKRGLMQRLLTGKVRVK